MIVSRKPTTVYTYNISQLDQEEFQTIKRALERMANTTSRPLRSVSSTQRATAHRILGNLSETRFTDLVDATREEEEEEDEDEGPSIGQVRV